MTALQSARARLAPLSGRLGVGELPLALVLAFTAVGLVARLAWLGARPMHYDEARVAFRVLEALNTGTWTYQWEIHGPLLQHVDRWLFGLLGPGDALARLPVAVVGGLLPLSALLFRSRLREYEVAAMAGLLALNPLLLYYSRFMRSDVLVAAFSLVALGFLVRAYDAGRAGYLAPAAVALGLAFSSKENAIVYVLCWGGMLGLVAGLELLQPRRFPSRDAAVRWGRLRVRRLRRTPRPVALRVGGHAALAAGLFALVVGFMYAPRQPPGVGTGLGHSGLPAIVGATADTLVGGVNTWAFEGFEKTCGGYSEGDGELLDVYACNLGREATILARSAFPVALLAAVGFAVELGEDDPRVLVPAAFYWGVASVLGYAWGTDIPFPGWVAVHVVVPLTIPAAAGAVAGVRIVREELAFGDGTVAASVGVLALLLSAAVVGSAVHHSYVAPSTPVGDSPSNAYLIQYAQPESSFRGAVDAMDRAAAANDGTDVLVYGDERIVAANAAASDPAMPGCVARWEVLPLFWYLYSSGATVDCAGNESALEAGLEEAPPVVITRPETAGDVRQRVGADYVSREYDQFRGANAVVFFFDASRVTPPPTDGR